MPFETPPLIAGDNIRTHRFIKLSAAADHTALEANAGEMTIGITTGASREAPQDGANTYAALSASGDSFEWRTPGQVALLQLDTSGCAANDLLMSDADGLGDVAEDGNFVGAVALEAIANSEIGEVLILSPFYLENT